MTAEQFDPYYEWLGIRPKDQPPTHYRLLAIEPLEDNFSVIARAADRQMAYLRTIRGVREAPLAQKLLNEIAAARVCLLNPETKESYDAELRRQLESSLTPTPPPAPIAPAAAASDAPGNTGAVGNGAADPAHEPPSPDRTVSGVPAAGEAGGGKPSIRGGSALPLPGRTNLDPLPRPGQTALDPQRTDAREEAVDAEVTDRPELVTLLLSRINARVASTWGRKSQSVRNRTRVASIVLRRRAYHLPGDLRRLPGRLLGALPRLTLAVLWMIMLAPLAMARLIDWLLHRLAGHENHLIHGFLRVAAVASVLAAGVAIYLFGDPMAAVGRAYSALWADEDANSRGAAVRALAASKNPSVGDVAVDAATASSDDPPSQVVGEIKNQLGMTMRLIPAGEFTMGSPEDELDRDPDEGPTRRVTITRPFYIGSHEVTQEQFEKLMEANPSHFRGGNRPVDSVLWEEAVEFCRRLSQREERTYRLPTEAEWEYAARADTSTRWSFGDAEKQLKKHAWYAANSKLKTQPVGRRNANPWGLHDVHGNVWEWCSDWYAADTYRRASAVDPTGPSAGSYRVYRGGGWLHTARQCRSANRPGYPPGYRASYLGFRILAPCLDEEVDRLRLSAGALADE